MGILNSGEILFGCRMTLGEIEEILNPYLLKNRGKTWQEAALEIYQKFYRDTF